MKNLEIVKVGFFLPITKHLQHRHVNLDRALKISGLHKYDYMNEEAYVPFQLFEDFYSEICRKEDINEISKIILNHLSFDEISSYGEALGSTDSLFQCLSYAAKYDKVILSGESMNLETKGVLSIFSSSFNFSSQPNGRNFFELHNLAAFITAFRFFLGEDWDPIAIHVQSRDLPLDIIRLNNPEKVKIRENQATTSLIFFTNELFGGESGNIDKGRYQFENIESTSLKIKYLLESDKSGSIPSVDQYSDMMSISRRTLIRKLAREETSFKELVEQWRFSKASKLLGNSTLSVSEISNMLYYGCTSNFIRAFKSWANTTPQKYRKQLIKGDRHALQRVTGTHYRG